MAFAIVGELIVGDLPVAAQSLNEKSASSVMREDVWRAVVEELQERGYREDQLPRVEDLNLPAALAFPLAAADGGKLGVNLRVKLRVTSACRDAGPERTQFRLECGETGQCLPFLVYLYDD